MAPPISAVHAVAPPGARLPLGVFITHPNPPSLFEELAQLGVGGVEPNIMAPLEFDPKPYYQSARDHGLAIPAVSTGLSTLTHHTDLSHPDPRHREDSLRVMMRFLEIAVGLESPLVVIGVARGRCRGDCTQALDRLRDSLEHLDKQAGAKGLRLVLEPLNRYETDLVNTVGEALGVVDGLENVGLLLDTFHAMLEHASPQEALRLGGPRVWHVHFADSNRRAPGRGIMDWKSITRVLDEIGYKGFASIEARVMPGYREELSHALGILGGL